MASPYPIRWLPKALCAQVTSTSGPGSRSNHSNDRCWQSTDTIPVIGTKGPITKDTILAISVGSPVIEPLAPVSPLVEPPILVVYLKDIICYTKHLKIFYIRKILYFKINEV